MGKKKFVNRNEMKLAFIGDEDTVTGFALAGIGSVDGQGRKNFLVVDKNTRKLDIEASFLDFTSRNDVCIVLISQTYADDIRHVVREYNLSGKVVPTVLEIPSKDCPYDPAKDPIMQRVQVFFGENLVL
eukprot:GEMP01072766.1.p1 GENE.GEMP01072766.1~~GEMP01072766.1.p1  ORF type:complete len:129 (+),score=30.69 GEMP01072766.1:40-426(+)